MYVPDKNLLMYARIGNLNGVKYCIHLNADINVKNEWSGTPLYLACQYQHADIVEYLLESGADHTIATNSGRTPLDIAYTLENEDIVSIFEMYGINHDDFQGESTPPESEIHYQTPTENTWFKHSPLVYIIDALRPGGFTALRRIHARIKYLFS